MSEVIPYGLLHKVLRQFGYKRDPSASHLYKQDIDVKGVVFPVQLILYDPYLEQLPAVLLRSIPKELPGRLPHVMKHLALCYIEQSSIYMDRYAPEENMTMVLNLVLSLLHQYVEHPELLQEEFRRELSYYWESELYDCCYLLSDKTKNLSHAVFNRKRIDNKDDKFEIIIGEEKQLKPWIEKRNGAHISDGHAKIITLSNNIVIPEALWPPDSLLEVIDWLTNCGDRSASNQLIDITAVAIAENMSFTVIFKLGTIHLGIFVIVMRSSVTKVLKEALGRNKNYKKIKPRINLEQKLSLIKRAMHHAEPSFYRVRVEDATIEYVIGRNINNKKNLGQLRIAQIGCGTVGGIAAQMLVQSGAGTNTGNFDLYDLDIIRSGNLGRHVLGMKYLGENKAVAIAHSIRENNVDNVSVNAFTAKIDALHFVKTPRKYDLIIDATGDYKFSTMLSHYMRRSNSKIPIIYGWVDALGLASRGLFDDGKKGYACHYCITTINKKTGLQNNLFKPNVEIPQWQPEACGVGSFLPFSSQASVCTAGLIQGLCMDWVNGDPTPRFRHITVDNKRVHDRKSKNVKSQKDCPCCQF